MYKHVVNLACANRAAALTQIFDFLVSIGWELHDNRDGASTRVYRSNGEGGTRIKEYIQIYWTTANRIHARAWYYWDATTGTGSGGAYSMYIFNLTTSESGFYLWMYGDKDMVTIMTKVGASYTTGSFGHIQKRMYENLLTSLTSPATSGSNVTINVTNTSPFTAGRRYQIVGNNHEGRDMVTVSSITSSTTMVISSLPRNYSAGSLIGGTPSTFCHIDWTQSSGSAQCMPTCLANVSGLANLSYSATVATPFNAEHMDPDKRAGEFFTLQPTLIADNSGLDGEGTVGTFGILTHPLRPPVSTTIEDTFSVGQLDAGTSTGNNTSTTLNDTSKSWTTNQFANKVVIITLGVGAGQICKIASNTATQLTLSSAYTFSPIPTTSQYVICDMAYRLLSQALAVREGI